MNSSSRMPKQPCLKILQGFQQKKPALNLEVAPAEGASAFTTKVIQCSRRKLRSLCCGSYILMQLLQPAHQYASSRRLMRRASAARKRSRSSLASRCESIEPMAQQMFKWSRPSPQARSSCSTRYRRELPGMVSLLFTAAF